MTSYLTKQRTDREARIERAKKAVAKGIGVKEFAASERVSVQALRNFMRQRAPDLYEQMKANGTDAAEPPADIEQDRIERLSRDTGFKPDRAAWLLSAFAVPTTHTTNA